MDKIPNWIELNKVYSQVQPGPVTIDIYSDHGAQQWQQYILRFALPWGAGAAGKTLLFVLPFETACLSGDSARCGLPAAVGETSDVGVTGVVASAGFVSLAAPGPSETKSEESVATKRGVFHHQNVAALLLFSVWKKTHLSYILLLQLSGWNVMQILQDCQGVIIHDE